MTILHVLGGNNSGPFGAPAQKRAAGRKQPGGVKRPAPDQQLMAIA
jgi:hypothetical protein